MKLDGSLKLASPSVEKKKEIFLEELEQEFTLNLIPGEKEKVENFGISVTMDEDDIELSTDFGDDGDFPARILIHLENPKTKDHLEFIISLNQAKTLKNALQHFIDSFYSIKVLTSTQKIDLI